MTTPLLEELELLELLLEEELELLLEELDELEELEELEELDELEAPETCPPPHAASVSAQATAGISLRLAFKIESCFIGMIRVLDRP